MLHRTPRPVGKILNDVNNPLNWFEKLQARRFEAIEKNAIKSDMLKRYEELENKMSVMTQPSESRGSNDVLRFAKMDDNKYYASHNLFKIHKMDPKIKADVRKAGASDPYDVEVSAPDATEEAAVDAEAVVGAEAVEEAVEVVEEAEDRGNFYEPDQEAEAEAEVEEEEPPKDFKEQFGKWWASIKARLADDLSSRMRTPEDAKTVIHGFLNSNPDIVREIGVVADVKAPNGRQTTIGGKLLSEVPEENLRRMLDILQNMARDWKSIKSTEGKILVSKMISAVKKQLPKAEPAPGASKRGRKPKQTADQALAAAVSSEALTPTKED